MDPSPPLSEVQATARAAISQLPPAVRRLQDPETYPVRTSQALDALVRQVTERVGLAD